MICQDCKKWCSCKKAERVCEDFEKIHRKITRLESAEDGIYKFKVMEENDDL